MIYISHRGNISGPNPILENSPEYINQAISSGFDVEIDVWKIDSKWFLGHDSPQYPIDISFLKNPRLWCHAKNIPALKGIISEGGIRCFWHQEDDVTLTSDNFLWTYPGKASTDISICVMPESVGIKPGHSLLSSCAGICSDFIKDFKSADSS